MSSSQSKSSSTVSSRISSACSMESITRCFALSRALRNDRNSSLDSVECITVPLEEEEEAAVVVLWRVTLAIIGKTRSTSKRMA